jgi:hypothetical protein
MKSRRLAVLLTIATAVGVQTLLAACAGDRDKTWIGKNAGVTIDSEAAAAKDVAAPR